MNNFGVIEVASTKTKNAPGWAYVPDNAPNPAAAAFPTSRKNRAARNQANLGLADLSAKQDAKVRKDLEALDKEPSSRDVAIPPRAGRAQTKHTPNVRKILQSQKTFANHLDDYLAFRAVAESNPQAAAHPPWLPPAPAGAAAAATSNLKRSASNTHKSSSKSHRSTTATPTAASTKTTATPKPKPEPTPDTDMPDAPPPAPSEPVLAPQPTSYPPDTALLPAYNRPPPAPHPGDADPLLVSRGVPFPSEEELRRLLTAAPLGYLEARAVVDEGGGYPERKFCEVCGYWGRVNCGKCGGRVCALECLETHREECLRRYGL